MKKGAIWIILTVLMVISLVLASCSATISSTGRRAHNTIGVTLMIAAWNALMAQALAAATVAQTQALGISGESIHGSAAVGIIPADAEQLCGLRAVAERLQRTDILDFRWERHPGDGVLLLQILD